MKLGRSQRPLLATNFRYQMGLMCLGQPTPTKLRWSLPLIMLMISVSILWFKAKLVEYSKKGTDQTEQCKTSETGFRVVCVIEIDSTLIDSFFQKLCWQSHTSLTCTVDSLEREAKYIIHHCGLFLNDVFHLYTQVTLIPDCVWISLNDTDMLLYT